ncbi:hypothetical protein JYK22_08000, partial [Nonomuraea sp. RK-328]|nr:hypothetical protein [Nonomuraea sp. RK-328]
VLRRYRSGVPALLVTGVYAVAVAVAGVVALTAGDLGPLWWLTVFVEQEEDVTATSPRVLVLVLAGAAWAWALWQSLRGPLAGPPPELDRDTRRLRQVLYAVAAASLLLTVLPSWPWWTTAVLSLMTAVMVVLFQPVVGRNLEYAGYARTAGVLGYGGTAAVEVLDEIGVPVPGWLPLICGFSGLVWMVLALRAQRWDGRWRRSTVRYGIAALVVPLAAAPAAGVLFGVDDVYASAMGATGALMVIWLARTAHELADPRPEPAPSEPVPSGPVPSEPVPSEPSGP